MRVRKFWPAPLLISLCLALSALHSARATSTPRSIALAPPHLYIMFLPGLCGWPGSDPYCHGQVDAAARARGTFRTLINALSSAHVPYTPLYYSYSVGHPNHYSVSETHQSVARSTDALEQQLRTVSKRDPGARFDLVGHSLGGVVAASWAVSDGRRYGYHSSLGLLGHIGSIVTFDSPLHGIRSQLISNIATQIFGGAVWYSLQPDQETIKEILFFPNQWWKSTGHLHTIGNSADLIVPASDALLGFTKEVHDTHCSQDILFLRSCHGAVLSDASLNQFVTTQWIAPSVPRPTPTVIPTPSPSATATETPVVTSTPLPPSTITPTPSITAVSRS